jgi:CheY-like chemotaxis protein
MQPVRVDDLIQVVTLTLGPQVREKSQTLAVKLEPDLPPILGDRDRLLQLLTNLVSNAYKYTLPGGDIGIEARQDDGWLDVSVSDTGVGISPEDQEKLFTRFFRVDSSLTSEIGGTGLGLTIVKSIAELHSGSVSLVSELGKGSTFTVRLPVAEGLEEPGLPPGHEDRPATPAPQGHRILVVEDDPDVARLIRRYLERAGYLVETVLSAEEALQHIEQQCPDLITLDINLPGMDGFELAERLAARPDTREIPILVVSIVHDGAREVSFGLVGALPKPIDQQQLVSTIGEALGDSQKGQVLVVDDDPGVRKLLGVALEKQGFEVLEAEDGASALELAQQKRPGLVLLDLGLPKIDGSDVLQQLKENPDTAELPVVVISGSESLKGGARARVLALGAADFLTKPFDLDELISEVRILIEGG